MSESEFPEFENFQNDFCSSFGEFFNSINSDSDNTLTYYNNSKLNSRNLNLKFILKPDIRKLI